MFLKNKNIIFKIRRSKVTDYAALSEYICKIVCPKLNGGNSCLAIIVVSICKQSVK